MPRFNDDAILAVAARIEAGEPLDVLHRTIAVATLNQAIEADALCRTLDVRLAQLARDVPASRETVTVMRSFIHEYLHGVE